MKTYDPSNGIRYVHLGPVAAADPAPLPVEAIPSAGDVPTAQVPDAPPNADDGEPPGL